MAGEKQVANPKHSWLVKLVEEHLSASDNKVQAIKLPSDLREAWQVAAGLLQLKEFELCRLIADAIGCSVAKVEETNPATLSLIPERFARRYQVFPHNLSGRTLKIATANPTDHEMISVLSFASNHTIDLEIASPGDIDNWIAKGYGELSKTNQSATQVAHPDSEHGVMDRLGVTETKIKESIIAEIVNKMLHEAFNHNASDIHIEPFVSGGVVRYRVDGLLRRISTLPLPVFNQMVQFIKVISKLNIATKLVPQDGSTTYMIDKQHIDLRISTIPVSGGEKVVIRLLKQTSVQSLENVGIATEELVNFKELIARQSGIFIMTGPTGSGKTTTLYSALKELNSVERCLVTIEDPVEFQIEGIAQISVNQSQGVTFATALRALLRQDPDVMLVGEIRDEETADITLRAALTGHFVLSTLHTNDAITAVARLLNLGIAESVLADALAGLAAQRLVRRLCSNCASVDVKQPSSIELKFKTLTGATTLKQPVGCEACEYTGFYARFPLLELLTINSEMAEAIRRNEPTNVLRQVAKESGMRTLAELGKKVVMDGQSSVDEVHRVLGYSLIEPN